MALPVTRGVWFMGGATPDFFFDAVISEAIELESEVTKEPVETGVVVSDHMVARAARIEIEAIVSDTPLDPSVSDVFASEDSRAGVALARIEALKDSAEPFNYQSGLRFFENVVIERISVTQDWKNRGWLRVRITLVEVRITNTETVTYPPRKAGKTKRQAAATVTKGTQETKPVESKAKARSVLLQQVSPEQAQALDATGATSGLLAGLAGVAP